MKLLIILFCIVSGSVHAQKKSSFQYQILRNNIPFDIENESLTYADSNSILQILVSNPKLPRSIAWEVTEMSLISKVDSRMLNQIHRHSSSTSLLLAMRTLLKSCKTMLDKGLSHKPGFLIEIKAVTGTKGVKSKYVKLGHILNFNINEGIE